MKVIGVIPARYQSSRFPGKPLAKIAGKPLLQWVIEGSRQSKALSEVHVATDDTRIQKLAEDLGASCLMTSPEISTGTDRVWEAAKHIDYDVVVNIQGDEPLLTGELIDTLVRPFTENPSADIDIVTLAREMRSDDLNSPQTAKIVLNDREEALYFSRHPIPYSRNDAEQLSWKGSLKHIGLYAYRKKILEKFCHHGPVEIEVAEGLEQLRALYLGARIRVVKVDHESWGVDSPGDIQKIEGLLKQMKGS